MEDTVFCKIQDVKKSYYLFTTVKDNGKDGFHLILCDGKDSWEGDISGDYIHDQCSITNLDYKKYVEMTVQALTGKSHPGIGFQYQVEPTSEDSVQFYWKKHIVKEDVKFRLGSTKLIARDDGNKTIQEIFDYCIGKISNLNHKITSTHMDNERLSQERANALNRLDNCVSAKEKLEEDLYSKFLMVLNSKKKEIGNLRQKVEDHQNSEGADNLGSDGDNSSSYSIETQKDEPDSPKPAGGKKAKLNDDSLVFTDDSDLDEVMDNEPRNKKPAMEKVVSSKASTSNITSEFDISKIKKMKKEISQRSPGLINESTSDLVDTFDLLDDF